MTTPPDRRRPLSPEQKAEVEAAPYEAGFGKPPKATQFKRGQSGNPTGRPKGARALKTDLEEDLDIEVTVQLPDGPKLVTMQQAMVLSTSARAAKGDPRSAMLVLRMMELATPDRLKEATEAVKLDPTDRALLSKMMSDFGVGDQLLTISGSQLPVSESNEDDEGYRNSEDDLDWNIL